jgi:hypothetical protein
VTSRRGRKGVPPVFVSKGLGQAGQQKLSGVGQVQIEPLQFAGEGGDHCGRHSASQLATQLEGARGGSQGRCVRSRRSYWGVQSPPDTKERNGSKRRHRCPTQERGPTPP